MGGSESRVSDVPRGNQDAEDSDDKKTLQKVNEDKTWKLIARDHMSTQSRQMGVLPSRIAERLGGNLCKPLQVWKGSFYDWIIKAWTEYIVIKGTVKKNIKNKTERERAFMFVLLLRPPGMVYKLDLEADKIMEREKKKTHEHDGKKHSLHEIQKVSVALFRAILKRLDTCIGDEENALACNDAEEDVFFVCTKTKRTKMAGYVTKEVEDFLGLENESAAAAR